MAVNGWEINWSSKYFCYIKNSRKLNVNKSLTLAIFLNMWIFFRHWKNELHAAQKNGRQPKFVKALIKVFFWECLYYGGWIFFVTVILR